MPGKMFCSKLQLCSITGLVCNKRTHHSHLAPAVTDVAVTGENEFRIVSELSRELIVAWPLFMKRRKAKRLVFLLTISQQRWRGTVCVCVGGVYVSVLFSLTAGAATPGRAEESGTERASAGAAACTVCFISGLSLKTNRATGRLKKQTTPHKQITSVEELRLLMAHVQTP